MRSVAGPIEARPQETLSTFGSERAWTFAALAGITCLAAALRFHDLVAPSLWFDELASVAISRVPLSLLWSDWMVREPNPPLYYAILHVWMRIFGESEFAVRAPSVLIGSLAPLLVYAIGQELGRAWPTGGGARARSTRIALLAALLTALSMRQVASSQEARAYIFAEAAALVAILGMVRLLATSGGRESRSGTGEAGGAALYIAGCTAALYFHTTMVVLPLLANVTVLAVWLTRDPRPKRLALVWIGANAVCLILWLWWISIALQQFGSAPPDIAWMRRPGPGEATSLVLGMLLPRSSDGLPRALGLTGLALACLGAMRLPRRQALVLLLFALGVPLILYALSFVTPVLTRRTLLWAQFAPTLLVAAGALGVASVALRGALAGAICLVAVSGLGDAERSRVAEPWREVVATLARTLGPDDTVVVPDASLGLAVGYYCQRTACRFKTAQVEGQLTRWSVGLYDGEVLDRDALARLFHDPGTVTAIAHTFATPEPALSPLATRVPGWVGPALPAYMDVSRWAAR